MAIKLEKINEKKKEGKISLLIKGSGEVFANTVRRLIVEEVPTLAVEDVEIKDNSSSLYDEMLALRLGLIPIKTDLKSYRLPENEAEIEEKSARCTLTLKLKSGKNGLVYAEETESKDPKCNFVYDKMPVSKLLSKQKIDVTLTAIMGQGKDHVKWSPGWAWYKKEPVLKLGNIKDQENLMKNCTDGVFSLKSNKLTINNDKIYESKLLDYYSQLDQGVNLEYSDNIIFNLESWGQLTCKEILQKSSEILIEKTEEMESLI